MGQNSLKTLSVWAYQGKVTCESMVRLRKAHWKDMAGADHCQYPPVLHRLDQEEGYAMKHDEKEAVTQVLNDYIRVFGSFDAQRVLPY